MLKYLLKLFPCVKKLEIDKQSAETLASELKRENKQLNKKVEEQKAIIACAYLQNSLGWDTQGERHDIIPLKAIQRCKKYTVQTKKEGTEVLIYIKEKNDDKCM